MPEGDTIWRAARALQTALKGRAVTAFASALPAVAAAARRFGLVGRQWPASKQHWVYRRSGHPCLRCGTTVRRRMQGDPARSTYFCPRCQP